MRGEMIAFARRDSIESPAETWHVFQRCRIKVKSIFDINNSPLTVSGTLNSNLPYDAVVFMSLIEQKLGGIQSILAGDSRN